MPDEKDAIKARINIVELIGQRVALKKAGRHWKGLCPFHEDRNPSFYVNDTTGHYRCWACGEAGDVFTWVMKTQNVEFREALELLARKAGVALSRAPRSAERSLAAVRTQIMEEARRFFADHLESSAPAREYCARRGLDEATLRDWEIGYAPDVDSALCTHLQKKGLPLAEAKALSLADSDPTGGYFDRFRGRLMFPIRNEQGDLVGFGGRALGDGMPKYINSGDTPLFRKSRVLYGLWRAREAVSTSKRLVLVEGYLDVIACHRSGIREAVASLGTALAEDHARLAKRWAERVVILYDSDAAGQKATERALDVLGAVGLKASVVRLEEGKDPDSLLREGGTAELRMALEKGVDPLEFRIAMVEGRHTPDSDEFWAEMVSVLAASPNHRRVDESVTALAQKYLPGQPPQVARASLLDQIRKARTRQRRVATAPPISGAVVRTNALSPAEAAVLCGVLQRETRHRAWPVILEPELFVSEAARTAALALAEAFPGGPPDGAPLAWLDVVKDDRARETLLLADQPELNVTAAYLEECAAALRRTFETKQIEAMKREGLDDAKLAAIQERLRAIKTN